MSLYKPTRDKLTSYDSPEAFFEHVMKLPEGSRTFGNYNNYNSFSGISGKDALYKLSQGDRTNLKDAESLLETMRTDGLLSVGQKLYQTSIVGSYPCVPNFLMGQPDTMYKLVESEISSDKSPISIYVELVASAGISVSDLVKRGNAILGFVMAMQNIRPINLYSISVGCSRGGNHAEGVKIKLETNPIDLDRALFILGNPGMFRELCYAEMNRLHGETAQQGYISWAWSQGGAQGNAYQQAMREMCGMDEKDVYITAPYLSDHEYIKNPIGWIKKELAKYTQLD